LITATPDAPTSIQHAYAEAKTEHSTPVERAEPSGQSPDTVASPSPDDPPVADPAQEAATDPVASSSPDLISEAELSALQQTHADDPAALAKALKGRYTQKTQALAEERKAVAEIARHADFLRAYQADPEGTIRAEAERLGIPVGSSQPVQQMEDAVATADTWMADFRTQLGPDLSFLADALAPAVQRMAEQIAQRTVESTVAPLKQAQTVLVEKAAREQSEAMLQAFTAKHPDWKTHEAAMMGIANRVSPKPGMAEAEYLDLLYNVATLDHQKAMAAQAAIERMTKAARTAEPRTDGFSDAKVDVASPKNLSIREAFAAAKQEASRR